ncbi:MULTISPECIES: hypothetical protein [Pseudomonas syringae group]|uniref:Uncharacterized protein n=1 Tax=Pseudomonas syringae pv. persicae TaxID=237306 RepID=A0AB38EN04_9PSED|nr:hypothetical protein [Pseudomonas syringae group genomosp. 3]SOQ16434.1 hypothetical protein NCPPB2254_05901 [Pseudomonas syringae pv. persicae]SOQ16470.1 hypothetical protein CFBP1573P_06121 [Pseudomonas syringae pv. persicae]
MQAKNSTTSSLAQQMLETQPVVFNEAFMDGRIPTVADALNQSSSLLCSVKAILAQISGTGEVDESVAFGVLFIVTGAKALLDSTIVSVERVEGGAQ